MENREVDGFVAFQQVLDSLEWKNRGVYTTTSSLCDAIIQIIHSCLPDYDLDSIDTLAWHARVRDNLARHTNEQEQLFYNLPRPIATLFRTSGARIVSELEHGLVNKNSRVNSVVELDRSRLTLIPLDVQRLLFDKLPAVSMFAVMSHLGLADETKKDMLLRLMDRDIFGPMSGSEMPRRAFLANMEKLRPRYDAMSYSQLLNEYDIVTGSVASALVNNVALSAIRPSNVNALNIATEMVLEGRHFALVFSLNRAASVAHNRTSWMVHPVVSKRLFKVIPGELGVAIRNFTTQANQKELNKPSVINSRPLTDLVALVVKKIDPSVGWRIRVSPRYLWPSFIWCQPDGFCYKAPLDEMISDADTAYRLVATRRAAINEGATRYPPDTLGSSLAERLMD